jgi:ATP-dependent DNA ligase
LGFAISLGTAYLRSTLKPFEFCLPTNGNKVPAGPEWLHEIKQDGFRIRVEPDRDRVRLITGGGYDWSRFPSIEAALKNRIKAERISPSGVEGFSTR